MQLNDRSVMVVDSANGQVESIQIDTSRIDAIIDAWLNEKTKKADETQDKTRTAYEKVMKVFRKQLQSWDLDVDSDYKKVAIIADKYARTSYDNRGRVKSGRLAENTINQRLAILSSFYAFCHKYDDKVKNPIVELCKREKGNVHDAATYMEANDVNKALQGIDRSTLQGKRDYALLVLAITTGRRAAELVALVYEDIHVSGKKMQVTWKHCKGNKTMHDILGNKTREALEVYLLALHTEYEVLPDTPLFLSFSKNTKYYGLKPISTQAVSDVCKKYLGTSKVHTARHTFAVNSEESGSSLSEIGQRLGHSSLKTTSDYMQRLHSAENKHIDKLEALYGL